ncbi:MAG: flagellar protein FlaG [Desulfuromonadaceae bacterium]|nr:flagellar protein FlaG [Desulfuromonadaceae bacterium]
MNVEAINQQNTTLFQMDRSLDNVSSARKKVNEDVAQEEKVEKKQVQPEELLQQIKQLTEDGLYSVRFENDERSQGMVVKIVDRENDEVIRQIPPEELLDLTKRLTDLRGNLIDTQS